VWSLVQHKRDQKSIPEKNTGWESKKENKQTNKQTNKKRYEKREDFKTLDEFFQPLFGKTKASCPMETQTKTASSSK
jgi:hypothetical protein